MATNMLIGRVATYVYWTCTPLEIIIGYSNVKVGILTGYWIYSSYSIGGTNSTWVISVAYISLLLKINGLDPLILEQYIEYMLRSMGIKGGIVLYLIGYGITLGCHVISDVTGCC